MNFENDPSNNQAPSEGAQTHSGGIVDAESGAPRHQESPHRKRRGLGVVIVAVAVLALAYIGVKPRFQQATKLSNDVAALKAELPVVSVVSIKATPGASEVSLPSNLQAI